MSLFSVPPTAVSPQGLAFPGGCAAGFDFAYDSGPMPEWHQVTVDLSAFGAQTLAVVFMFCSDQAAFPSGGWYIDDVMVMP